jgi:DNA-directed RNA polymerase specialized sigma24 family protein
LHWRPLALKEGAFSGERGVKDPSRHPKQECRIRVVVAQCSVGKASKIRRWIPTRFFGGVSVEQTAEALGVSPQTVMRDWRLARAWLTRELRR